MEKHQHQRSLNHHNLNIRKVLTDSTTSINQPQSTQVILDPLNSLISKVLDPLTSLLPTIPTPSTTTRERRTTPTVVTTSRLPRTTSISNSVVSVVTNENSPVQSTSAIVVATPATRNFPASTTTPSRTSPSSIISNHPSTTPTSSSTNLSANSNGNKSSNHNSTTTIIIIVIVVLVLIILGIASFFGYKYYKKKKELARDEADGIVGNSAFRKEGNEFNNDEGVGEDFGNNLSNYDRNNNEKYYTGNGSSNGGNNNNYGSLASSSPGPANSNYNNYNNNLPSLPLPLPYPTNQSPYKDQNDSAGYAGMGTGRRAMENNQFLQQQQQQRGEISSPLGTNPSFLPMSPPSAYSNQQQFRPLPPQQERGAGGQNYYQSSPNNFSQATTPQSIYPPTSAGSSTANLLSQQSKSQSQQNQAYRPYSQQKNYQTPIVYNPDSNEEEDVASEIGSAAMMSSLDFNDEEEDNRKPLETIEEGDTSQEKGPFDESENQGTIFTVKRTFEPTMPDELVIFPGDQVLLLMKYDDGWCMSEHINATNGGPIRGVMPYDCLESSVPTPSNSSEISHTSAVPAYTIPSIQQPNFSTLSSPTEKEEIVRGGGGGIDENLKPPQLDPVRYDSPLGLPANFGKTLQSPVSSQGQLNNQQIIKEYTPHHSQKASLVNNDLPNNNESIEPVPNQSQQQQIATSPAESGVFGRDYNSSGVGNRSGEKGKRSSSLNASRDADLFVALGGEDRE